MRVLVVGSGPAGLILGAALGRRGHDVVSVDRDPGPSPDGWRRRGVMQFAHAHNFRPQVGKVLAREWPSAYAAWIRLGAVADRPGTGAADPAMRGVLSRRETLERALRQAAEHQPGLTLRTGHVDGLVVEGGRVRGAVVDGTTGRRGPRRRRVRPVRTRRRPRSCGAGRRPAGRRLRPGLRRPHLPAPGGRGARTDEHAPRLHRRAQRLPVPRLPPRARSLLGRPGPAHGGCRAQAAARAGRLRRGLRGHPGPGRLDRPRASRPDVRRPRRRGAAQRLPQPDPAPRPGDGGRRGRHDDPDARTRRRHGVPADRGAARAARRGRRPGHRGGPLRGVVRRTTSSRGWRTTSPSTAAW